MNKFFLNLGLQPLANNYLSNLKDKQKKYNLKLNFNTKTKLVSISKRISSKEMFNNKYPYRSSISQTMVDSFHKLSQEIKKKFNPKLLLEIGSNDGALIKNFNKRKAIGVEPCSNLANITKSKGYKTYNKYWNFSLAKKIKNEFKSIDLIYSANTLTHISNLNEVFSSITNLLSNDGVLIIEDPSLLECIKKNAYDQFYNEHIYVFSTLSLRNILIKHNLVIFDLKNLDTHGGSIRYYIKKKGNKNIDIKQSVKKQIFNEIKFGLNKFITFKKFASNVKKSKHMLCKLFHKIKQKNKIIAGYGATAKSTTILNFCNINNQTINFFVDTTPDKKNKFLPGTNIKILKYDKKLLQKVDYIFLGAWNFKKEIFRKEKKFIKNGGKFITHVPLPLII
jgi:methylation protein EvaC|tara:strand:- start:1870 stop:3048 length:1179 start_codon:yes stop_codon:yes gene_type:complete